MGEPLWLWTCGKLSAALRVSHMSTAPTTATGSGRGYGFVGEFDTWQDRSYDVLGCPVDRQCMPKSERWRSTLFWPIRGPKNGANPMLTFQPPLLTFAPNNLLAHAQIPVLHQLRLWLHVQLHAIESRHSQ